MRMIRSNRCAVTNTMNKTKLTAGAAVASLVLSITTYFIVKPTAPDFRKFAAGPERKQAFFSYILPMVRERNAQILETRQTLIKLQQKDPDASKVMSIASDYGLENFDPDSKPQWNTLLKRVDIVPPSLALAQAANESSWGTSRFAREGNNFFGQWCFTKGCGMVPTHRDTGKTHEVAEFWSPYDSVKRYIANLNRHDAYADLRQIRAQRRANDEPITGIALSDGLHKYSERGGAYIKDLKSMIRYNKLVRFDADPATPNG